MVEGARAGDDLPLPLPLEIHHAQVHYGTQVHKRLDDLQVRAVRLLGFGQANHLEDNEGENRRGGGRS